MLARQAAKLSRRRQHLGHSHNFILMGSALLTACMD